MWSDSDGLQACTMWGYVPTNMSSSVLDIVSSDKWLLRSSKSGMVRAFGSVPLLYCWFIVIFNLRRVAYNWRKIETMIVFVILFFTCCSASSYLPFVLAIVFLDNYQIQDALWVYFKKSGNPKTTLLFRV